MVGIILSSCIDSSEYQLDEVRLNPSLALPLVKGDLTLRDFLSDEDSANIRIYPDGLLYLSYAQELRTQGIRDLFSVPDRQVTRSFILPGGVLPPANRDLRTDSIVFEVDLGLSPEQLTEIALKTGQVSYSTSVIPASPNFNYEILVSLPDFKARANNQPLQFSARGNGTVPVGNYNLFLTNNRFDVKLVLVKKSHTTPINMANGTSVNIQLQFRSFDFSSIKGFFGSQTVALPAETIDVSLFEDAFDGADISLAQPKISLEIVNEYGVPCKIDFRQLEAAREGSVPLRVQLNPANPVTLQSPAVLGGAATTTIGVSNVKELLDYAPSQFRYQADARLNDGITSGVNFLADTSETKITMNIEVPLYGSASNVVVRDTVEVDWSDVDQSSIEKAALQIKTVNQLPLNGSVQLYLADKNFVVFDALLTEAQTNLIKGSSVNTSGELQSAGIYESTLALEQQRLQRIFEAKHLIVVAVLSTSRDANGNFPNVKFKADYALTIEAGVLADLKLNVKL